MTRFYKNASKAIQSTGKAIGGAIYKAGKKRYTTGGKANVGQIVKDVAFLKSVLNPEKKRFTNAVTAGQFGQLLNAGVTGGYLVQVPFNTGIVQGTSSSTRNGNSIKLSSLIFKAKLSQQANTAGPIRWKITIFTCKGNPQTTGNIFSTRAFYEDNAFSGVVDYNSDRNPDMFTDFQILGQRSGVLMGDSLAGQVQLKDVSMPIKCMKHMRWDNQGFLQELPVYIYAVADSGDVGLAQSGIALQYSMRAYFYDN